MKRITVILAAALTLVSCTPQAYPFLYNMQYPGEAGFILSGKTMSIAYLVDGEEIDSLYVNSLATGFEKGLEAEYFSSEENAIPLYSVEKDPAGQYASRDSLISLMMYTDADVMFLFDSPKILEADNDSVLCTSYLYVYDALNKKRDAVVALPITNSHFAGNNLLNDAQTSGRALSGAFASVEREEYYSLIYYEEFGPWTEAIIYVYDNDWEKAMNIWMKILEDDRDYQQMACACYNLAVGCYMNEQYELAREWLDRADEYYPISLSSGMRSRVDSMLL